MIIIIIIIIITGVSNHDTGSWTISRDIYTDHVPFITKEEGKDSSRWVHMVCRIKLRSTGSRSF